MECPACKLGLQRKEFILVSGYNVATNEVVNIRLPKNVYDKYINKLKSKPTRFMRIMRWFFSLFVKIEMRKTFTIETLNSKYIVS
jgi:hypothetical protein